MNPHIALYYAQILYTKMDAHRETGDTYTIQYNIRLMRLDRTQAIQ